MIQKEELLIPYPVIGRYIEKWWKWWWCENFQTKESCRTSERNIINIWIDYNVTPSFDLIDDTLTFRWNILQFSWRIWKIIWWMNLIKTRNFHKLQKNHWFCRIDLIWDVRCKHRYQLYPNALSHQSHYMMNTMNGFNGNLLFLLI